MQLSFLCVCLLPLTVSPEILEVKPESDQFFSKESITLTCEEQWSVKRIRTGSDQVQSCGSKKDFGVTYESESICVILRPTSSGDSGVYWCESADGRRSPQRPLSVTDRNLILDSPALPVSAGSNITLRCRISGRFGVSPVLFPVLVRQTDGAVVHDGPEWSFTVSQEHGGEYTCKDLRTGSESERRSLRVREPSTVAPRSVSPRPVSPRPVSPRPMSPTSSPLSLGGGSAPVLLGALGGVALLVLVPVLVFLRRRRSQTGSDPESADVTYADVTARRAPGAPPPGPSDDATVYSGVRTRPKGPEEVTYGEVTLKPNGKKKKKREDPNGPWSDPDVVYSSVRTRGSGGTRGSR